MCWNCWRWQWFHVRSCHEVHLEPLRLGKITRMATAARALWFRAANLFPPLCKFCSRTVETTEHSESSDAVERFNERDNFFFFPSCKLHPLYYIFCDFGKVIFAACVPDFDNFAKSIGCFFPCCAESKGVNPLCIDERMQVQVPASAFICYFQAVESTAPI